MEPDVNPSKLEQDSEGEYGYRSNPDSVLPEEYLYLICLNLPRKEKSPKLNCHSEPSIVVACDMHY